jgi:hypothetical protein
MNAVEIEQAVPTLAAGSFDAEEFAEALRCEFRVGSLTYLLS